MVAHSLTACFDSVRARVHSLHCLRARAPLSLFVVAHSVPGGLNLSIVRSSGESSVSGFALFTSLKLYARYITYMYILVHAALQAPCRSAGSFRFLIALIDPAILTQSGKSIHSA